MSNYWQFALSTLNAAAGRATCAALCAVVLSITGLVAYAQDTMFPTADWKDDFDPIASPDAVPGGSMRIFIGQYPKSFNYFLDNNVFSYHLFSAMYETLLGDHPVTLKEQPHLAQKWSISADKRTFTFFMDKKAKWSDGKPITAHDVKWTFDTVLDPKHLTGPHKVSLERFESPTVIDDHTIKFVAKNIHWKNLGALGGFHILPKHGFEKLDFNQQHFTFPVVSGSYNLGVVKEGISVDLVKRQDWWAKDYKRYQRKHNFDTITFKFFDGRENAYAEFLKGNIDLFAIYTSHRWVNQTKGDAFDRRWIIKQRIYNYSPIGFQGFAMNMRRDKFKDVRVRQALCYLLNRGEMNEKLMYNQYFLLSSYYTDLYDSTHSNPNTLMAFDSAKARELLKSAGWIADEKTGKLMKDGKPFVIRFLARSASAMKFLNIYREDLADVGIELAIDQKDWAAWSKDMDEFNYDMTWAAWGAGVRKDPEAMWHSKEATRKAGTNITGFTDDKVDALIQKQRGLFDLDARHAIVREVDKLVFDQHPYALLWLNNYTRLLYWNKFGTPSTVLSKYGSESSAYWYWWADPDAEAELLDAQDANEPLVEKPQAVKFDEAFQAK